MPSITSLLTSSLFYISRYYTLKLFLVLLNFNRLGRVVFFLRVLIRGGDAYQKVVLGVKRASLIFKGLGFKR